MAWNIPDPFPHMYMANMYAYDIYGRIFTRYVPKGLVADDVITAKDLNADDAANTVSSWSNSGGTWGISNGQAYAAGEVIAANDLNAAASGNIANSFEPTRLEFTKRFDDFLAISVAKSQGLAHNGNCRCEAVPYTPTPDADPEPDTPLVPTDIQVPDNFRVQEYLCVRMRFGFGDCEDDTELWSTPAGAQGRIRQILFDRDDVVSCEVVTVSLTPDKVRGLWKHKPAVTSPLR